MDRLKAAVIKEKDMLTFTVSNFTKEFDVYYSTSPSMENKKLLVSQFKDKFQVETPIRDNRLFFEILDENHSTGTFSTRLVQTESVDNFRDLGGYKTIDGKTVKYGYFYRSAGLSSVSEMDKILLENMGISTIFDLRSNMEVASEKDIELNNCLYINESGIRNMDDRFSKKDNFDMKSLMMELLKDNSKISEMMDFVLGGYESMVKNNSAFKVLFKTLKNEERLPIVFHCTAGKDRTGVAGALILLALGVDEETVIEDYCLSNIYREKTNQAQLSKIMSVVSDENIIEVVKTLFTVKKDYLMVTLKAIKDKYDTYEDYVINDLKVSREELKVFREKYLF